MYVGWKITDTNEIQISFFSFFSLTKHGYLCRMKNRQKKSKFLSFYLLSFSFLCFLFLWTFQFDICNVDSPYSTEMSSCSMFSLRSVLTGVWVSTGSLRPMSFSAITLKQYTNQSTNQSANQWSVLTGVRVSTGSLSPMSFSTITLIHSINQSINQSISQAMPCSHRR